MSKLTDIKAKINTLEGGAFQELCDALLSRMGYEGIHAYGMQTGTMKTTIGNPDTYFKSKSGKYIFVAYTTQKNNLFNKAKEDIEKCLDSGKTGIKEKDIEEIIFCHTSSNLSAGQDKALAEMCTSRGILFSIYGIDRIADEIYKRHKVLAKDHLGIAIDTNQILQKRDFVEKYDSNQMMAPLSTIFQFRKEEYDEMMVELNSKKVVGVIGKAGVGKTRLSLEVAQDYSSKYEYKLFCIKSMDLSIFEDVASYLDKPGKYMFLIDDANELIGLKYVLEYINMSDKGYDVKIICTLRDYTMPKVVNEIRQYTEPYVICVKPFTDEQIKEFLDVNMAIRNRDYVDTIIRIAEGNPRIAYMAGKLAKAEQSLSAINDATQLYENYYNKYLLNSEITTNTDLCLTASIISLLHTINFSDLSYIEVFLEKIGIETDTFIKMIYRLCEDEFVEIKLDKVAIISDQCLRNYMLYYTFYKKRVVPFSVLLEIGFRSFRNGIIKATGILWNIFSSDDVHNYLSAEIGKVWDVFKEESDELFYEFVKHFHDFRPEEVLLLAKEKIDQAESDEIDLEQIDFSKDQFGSKDEIIELLSGFCDREMLPEAIELMCDYVAKKQSIVHSVMQCLKTDYSIDKDSDRYGYYTVRNLVETVKEKRNCPIITKLFLGIADHFLEILYRPTEAGRGNTLVMYTIPLIFTKECEEYRQKIWEELIKIGNEKIWEKDIKAILDKYSQGWHDEVEKELIEFDKNYVVQLIDILWMNNEIQYGIIAKRMQRKWKHYEISCENEFDMIYQKEAWKLYNVFADKYYETDLSYEEAREKRRSVIHAYATASADSDMERILVTVNQMVTELGQEKYEIVQGLQLFIDAFCHDGEKLKVFVQEYFKNGNQLDLSPYTIIKYLIHWFGVEYVYELICTNDFPQKNLWGFTFFEVMPEEAVNQQWLDELIVFLGDDSDKTITSSAHRDMRCLDKFCPLDSKVYCRAAKIIMEKREYNPFIVKIYLNLFFNNYAWKPEELKNRFSTDMDLLKDMYFYLLQIDSHTDYDGKFLKYFISYDYSWLAAYVKYFCKEKEVSGIYEHDRIVACWDLDNYIEVFDYLFEYVVNKNAYFSWRMRHGCTNLLIYEQGKEVRNERKDQWIIHAIESHNQDEKKMVTLFEIIAELNENIRRQAIALFIQANKDYELFARLPLEPNHWGGTGSMLPCMHGRIKFYESLLPYFTGIDLLKHKQHIQNCIKIWKKRIEHQEVEELMEKLYF